MVNLKSESYPNTNIAYKVVEAAYNYQHKDSLMLYLHSTVMHAMPPFHSSGLFVTFSDTSYATENSIFSKVIHLTVTPWKF